MTARLGTALPRLVAWAVDGVALIVAAAVAVPVVVSLLVHALGVRVLVPIVIAGAAGALVTVAASRSMTVTWTKSWDRSRALFVNIAAGYEGAINLRAHGRAGAHAARLRSGSSASCEAEARARIASTVSTWGAFGATLVAAATVVWLSGGSLSPRAAISTARRCSSSQPSPPFTRSSAASPTSSARATTSTPPSARARSRPKRPSRRATNRWTPPPSIRFEAVGYSYAARNGETEPVVALEGVDLVFRARERGHHRPNGAGRRRSCTCSLGVVRPDRGRILVGQREARLDNRSFRARVAYLSQRPFELRQGSIGDNLRAFDATLGDVRLLEALSTVGIRDLLRGRTSDDAGVLALPYAGLSRGQARRVMLARALLRDADLLVLDEPEAHLDGAGVVELKGILKTRCAGAAGRGGGARSAAGRVCRRGHRAAGAGGRHRRTIRPSVARGRGRRERGAGGNAGAASRDRRPLVDPALEQPRGALGGPLPRARAGDGRALSHGRRRRSAPRQGRGARAHRLRRSRRSHHARHRSARASGRERSRHRRARRGRMHREAGAGPPVQRAPSRRDRCLRARGLDAGARRGPHIAGQGRDAARGPHGTVCAREAGARAPGPARPLRRGSRPARRAPRGQPQLHARGRLPRFSSSSCVAAWTSPCSPSGRASGSSPG